MAADRELYALIAKAAGITGYVCEDWNGPYFCTPANPEIPRSEPVFYRWLHDDGDTLRLSVKLGIEHKKPSRNRSIGRVVQAWFPADGNPARSASTHVSVAIKGDVLAATRRAVACAAAEIGKAMP